MPRNHLERSSPAIVNSDRLRISVTRMSELSSFLKVSNGNVTGIVDRLVADGLIMRVPVEGDRRAMLVRLTRKGEQQFAAMATAHEGWIADLLGDVPADEADRMIAGLDRIDRSLGDRP